MSVYDLILKRRTIRKFKQEKIQRHVLEKLINAARLAPSASNLQPIKYIIVDEKQQVDAVFEHVKWAGYIAPYGDPAVDERPVAFVIMLLDTEIRKSYYDVDIGAAASNLTLAALEEGIGACWMGAIDRDAIRAMFQIPDKYVISLAIALGYPAESPVAEEENGSIKYYKDENGVLHVPKRKLKDIIIM